ncbi:hypothetical protein QTG54_005202 [Skeletonema marinoi]|uniref:Uncharacterized protein n=1 Tax=Skeletonema marinoi TaxID=267567 RepID=A0AAD8YDP9_9STRA|nr:hypothetical protein QTG54_005202 [Skeletonema marinoi]
MISYKWFITLLTLSLGRADHDVNEKYRLFDIRHDKQRIDGWQDSVAVNVDANVDVNEMSIPMFQSIVTKEKGGASMTLKVVNQKVANATKQKWKVQVRKEQVG